MEWSPDGSRIAYVTNADERGAELFVRWMDTGQTALLSNLPKSPGSITWSPDGQWIAFSSDRHGSADVFVMRADGSEPITIRSGPAPTVRKLAVDPVRGRLQFLGDLTHQPHARTELLDHVVEAAGRLSGLGADLDIDPAGQVTVVDDPAHQPVPGRHTHRERSIHAETDRSGLHPD